VVTTGGWVVVGGGRVIVVVGNGLTVVAGVVAVVPLMVPVGTEGLGVPPGPFVAGACGSSSGVPVATVVLVASMVVVADSALVVGATVEVVAVEGEPAAAVVGGTRATVVGNPSVRSSWLASPKVELSFDTAKNTTPVAPSVPASHKANRKRLLRTSETLASRSVAVRVLAIGNTPICSESSANAARVGWMP
jgi:hypothetical protein